ncbi:MAG: DUF72 domain-containing protein [Chitinophagaceae bacterium]
MGTIKWHIGCSGFHYRDWKGIFYPDDIPQRKWFEYYSSQFDTLELNVTFYRFPQLKFLQNWYAISPGNFSFSVKAPRLITHYKQFGDCERLLDDFYNTVEEGLKGKLGAVLFQLPPKFNYTPERLDLILASIRRGFRNTIEFRHSSWWNDEVYNRLKKEKVFFCGVSHPTLPDNVVVTGKTAYYRFHGVPKIYYSCYKDNVLKKIADSLAEDKKVKEAYVYFNNTATIGAIENAVWLKKYTQGI